MNNNINFVPLWYFVNTFELVNLLANIKKFMPYEVVKIATGMKLKVNFLTISFEPII